MNILLISECSKNALQETRRLLDQFAERKGERTWQTAITQDGLNTLRKLLRRSARRNTAVACHWLKPGGQSELLWIVGNLNRFNEQGTVPTNSTSRDILKTQDEHSWRTAEAMALLAGIAGLFHDVGKANRLFQHKLLPGSPLSTEPYRHEWISLRLFEAFVEGRDDRAWLGELAAITQQRDVSLRLALPRYQDKSGSVGSNPFSALPPLAQVIGWLIVSHHRLPQFVHQEGSPLGAPSLEKLQRLDASRLDASWISPQSVLQSWPDAAWRQVWDLDVGTPMASATWCAKAREIASRALNVPSLWQTRPWLDDRFSAHLARLALMLADHSYSASPATFKWQDPAYQAYANTDRATGQRKQKLDEHNIGVGLNAVLLARRLPRLRQHLPAITRHKGFKQRSQNAAFRWQDKAFDLARSLAQPSSKQGFFGINMASTGCGKTFANARIMYGLADEKLGCRFSIALGLRTLTLQTGDALQARLHLESDDLAVLIGSQSVQQLHELRKEDEQQARIAARGSESADSLCDELQHVRYEGSLDDGPLRYWLKQSDKLHQLISAPVLVSTIDHLIPATEGTRGGKQIAPMLRLLTSDLVLDEPDDFDLADLPALCRLVNWAGMLGSRVLLSSATLPPALVCALFEAYQSGRQHFNRACGEPGTSSEICCAWFDEFGCEQGLMASRETFKVSHNGFVGQRMAQLDKAVSSKLRPAALLPVSAASLKPADGVAGMAEALHHGMFQLHHQHHQCHAASGKTVSIGLIRMANINPLVAVSQQLLAMTPPADTRVHVCIYHSQHPMLVRSRMEARLDKALTRHDAEALWSLPEVQAALQQPERHHLFVVIASAVAEVGRDHDYDWAIAEPSSMRSLIQLAGRIQRHRKQLPSTPNLLILQKNYKALCGKPLAYCQPGFESTQSYAATAGDLSQQPFQLVSHDLAQILLREQFAYISANPRIQSPEKLQANQNLVALEHRHLALRLFGSQHLRVESFAAQWWQLDLHWCAETQRRSRFRDSDRDECFVLYQEAEGDEPAFYRLDAWGEKHKVDQSEFRHQGFVPAQRIEPWMDNSSDALVAELAERLERDIGWVSLRYTELRLGLRREGDTRQWHYDSLFGVYDPLK